MSMVLPQKDMDEIMGKLGTIVERNDRIDPELYKRYNVKRGLRDADGTGVLVGLTEIGDVRSYIIDEGEMVPTEGRLFYRGIEINDLVLGFLNESRFGFEECCYLLLFGELPDKKQLVEFRELLGEFRTLPAGFTEDMILKAPSRDIMNKLARSVLVSYSFDSNPDDNSLKNTLRQCIELIARFPTMAAYGYQAKSHYHDGNSLYIHTPKKELSTAENLLHMLRPNGKFTASEAEMLDLALVLHAEHGGGNVGQVVIPLVVAAAIGSLKGPQHGGANLKVMGMMEEIKNNVKDWADEAEVAGYLAKIMRKEAFDKSGLIYGVGHAVYTKSDPRTILLKQKAQELAAEKGLEKEYKLYTLIEKLSPEVFFKEKKSDKVICANVDFYSGFVYKSLDIPVELYTPIFAVGRIAGWCAHIMEELVNGGKIFRPAFKCVEGKKGYIPLDER